MKAAPKISEAEWAVMKVIWREQPCSAPKVIEALEASEDWSPATVKTLLNRLLAKGALSHVKEGRAYVYSAAFAEADLRASAVERFVDRVFDGALSPLLATFTRNGRRLKADELAALEKIVQEARRKP